MISHKISPRGRRFCFRPQNEWDLYCYLIEGNRHNFLIDTACGSDDALLMRAYIEKNCAPLPLIVINTHHDWDHIWGNKIFCDKTIIASQRCVENIISFGQADLISNAKYISGSADIFLPNLPITKPLCFPEDGVEIFSSLGHTDDGLCVYDRLDKVLYVGDNIGDNETAVVPQLSCDKTLYCNEIYKLKKFDFLYLASGHNKLQKPAFLDRILVQLDI